MTANNDRSTAVLDLLSDPIHIEPGRRLYTLLRHTVRSSLSQSVSVLAVCIDPDTRAPFIRDITDLSAIALGYSIDRYHGGIRVPGHGVDLGFQLVYHLSTGLFPRGFGCLGRDCPSCDHSNGDHAYVWHNDGGYALRQTWL